MRRPALVLVSFLLLGALPSAVASAQSVTGQGSSLAPAANYPYSCDTRWVAGYAGSPGAFGPGGSQEYVPQRFGPSTCSIWQAGVRGQVKTTHLVPGKGTVTVARVKSGPNPAPVSIGTVRRFSGRNPSDGTFSETCCRGVSQTPVVNPTPNAITEIPVNVLVDAQPFDPNTNRAGFHDIVVVNIHGDSGTLPIADLGGPKPAFGTPAGDPGAFWYFPKFDPSVDNQNQWSANGFEVLMNFDWVAAGPPKPPVPPTTPPGVTGPAATPPVTPPVTPRAPGQIRSTALSLKGRRVVVAARCATGTGKACAGTVRLRTNAKKPRLLAGRKVTIADGRTTNVRLTLSRSALKLVRGRSAKVRAEIDLGSAGRTTKTLTLRRK